MPSQPMSTTLEQISLEALHPSPRNPRTHSKAQITKIAASIERFGFVNPVLADGSGRIIAGHGRWQAARQLGLREVPVLRIEHLSDSERRAYVIADNRLAELAGWDRELLRLELGELSLEVPDLDLTLTGFETPEIDLILLGDQEGAVASDPKADAVPEVLDGSPVARTGDLWLLGPHRILCADARQPESYRHLLGDERVDLVFTDPPYNVKIAGHARGLGRHAHPDFAVASGEMSEAEFTDFLKSVCAAMAEVSREGAVHFVCMDWRHLFETLTAGRAIYDQLLNMCVWAKDNGGMGSLYRSQHELVLVWRTRGASHINNVELGRFGRNRTNVWRYAGANSFGRERDEMLALHPTVKPVALVVDAILDASHRGDLVLDPFSGSGTTLIAAEKTGRVARVLELEPRYVDVAIRRFEKLTATTARHAASGRTFEEERALRAGEASDAGEAA